MTRYIITAALLLWSAAACGGGPIGPSTPTTSTPTTNVFSGTLPVGGSNISSLVVTQASNATVMLGSLTSGGLPVAATVGLALGTPAEGETTCPHTIDRRTAATLTAQIRAERTAGTHCIEIYDVGGLTTDLEFAIRAVVTPVTYTRTPTPAPGFDAFTSILPVAGNVSRTVAASQSGSISTTITTASPPNLLVGLGLGIPRSDGSGCTLAMAVNTLTSAAAVVTAAVDSGSYCWKIFDPGGLSSNVNFTIAAQHP